MYFYKFIFEEFIPPIATTDFDIFLPNSKKISSNVFLTRIIDLDYVRSDDFISGKTKFYSKEGFEIEFLTLPNRTMQNVVRLQGLNVGAEALPKMLPITWNAISVDYHGFTINIPSPASFCLQKLLINNERSAAKKEKDIDAIKYMMPFIIKSHKYSDEFLKTLDNAPKKWKKEIMQNIIKNNIEIPEKNER